jgi:hypothetical protein
MVLVVMVMARTMTDQGNGAIIAFEPWPIAAICPVAAEIAIGTVDSEKMGSVRSGGLRAANTAGDANDLACELKKSGVGQPF